MRTGTRRWVVLAGASLLAVGLTAACGPIKVPSLLSTPAQDGSVTSVAPQAAPAPTPAAGSAVAVGGQAPASNVAGQAPAQAAAAPASSSSSSSRSTGPRTVAVKVDSIARTLSVEGSVSPQAQVSISYPTKATVADIKVKPGQTVQQGDELIEMDSTETARYLSDAQARLQVSQNALAQGQAQVAARQQSSAQQAVVDQRQQQQATSDAETALRHAQDNLNSVMAGASQTDRRTAQNAIDTAQAALQKAQDAQARLQSGPDPDAVRAAQREVATDQIALSKAQTDLQTLTGGPDPTALRAAQADLQKAQTQLQIAQTAKIDPKAPDPAVAKIQHDAAVQDAQFAVQATQARLDKLKQPPADTDVQSARQHVQDASDTLAAATDKFNALQGGPDQAAVDAAQAAVNKAQQDVLDAQGRLNQVNSHPTPGELADAQDQVRKAQAALEYARHAPASAGQADAPGGIDLGSLQSTADQDQATVQKLQQAMEDTKLKAPFDGTVVSVRVKIGDPVTSAKPVIVLAKPGAALLHVDLDDSQVSLLSVGQQGTAAFEGSSAPGAPLPAKIVSVTPASPDGSTSASATVQVTWGDTSAPRFGTLMSVDITLQQKDGVLVVPKNAVRTSGGRSSVEVQDGSLRHLVPVQVGLQSDSSVEIVGGLTAGQMVVVTGS